MAGLPTLRVVCGPTAAGKSAIALRLAARHGATIVSADSRQVYRGFDVGTAKPSSADRLLVPHACIDVAEPTERWSAARWADDAGARIAAAAADGREPLVVGGTGLYVRALVAPLFDAPPLEPARRARLSAWLATLDARELHRWCTMLDAPKAGLGRVQQLRAVETALLAGARLSDLQARRARAARWAPRYLLVDPGVERLRAAIASRAAAMVDAGWADEVRGLLGTVAADAPAWNASGYGVMRAMVAGELDREAAIERVVIETRQYAKRQRTWFRHQLGDGPVTRVDPFDPGVDALVERWWHGEELA